MYIFRDFNLNGSEVFLNGHNLNKLCIVGVKNYARKYWSEKHCPKLF